MEKIDGIAKHLTKIFSKMTPAPELHYGCEWCRDSGWVEVFIEHGKDYPIRFADTLQAAREKRTCYFGMASCSFCESGTFRGRPTAKGIKAAEHWVKANVTTIVSLSGIYSKAEEEGFSEAMIEQAFRRVGIWKHKLAGKWVCEPAA